MKPDIELHKTAMSIHASKAFADSAIEICRNYMGLNSERKSTESTADARKRLKRIERECWKMIGLLSEWEFACGQQHKRDSVGFLAAALREQNHNKDPQQLYAAASESLGRIYTAARLAQEFLPKTKGVSVSRLFLVSQLKHLFRMHGLRFAATSSAYGSNSPAVDLLVAIMSRTGEDVSPEAARKIINPQSVKRAKRKGKIRRA